MKYRITATKSKYLLKHAMYELTYEKLKDDPNWSIEPFTYTFKIGRASCRERV